MEELQSTEVLDREILEDARKKALRTLKISEDTINEDNKKWEKKLNNKVFELDSHYEKLKKEEKIRVTARLPIDKNRIKIEKLETLLKTAVQTWYKNLDRAKVLELLSGELLKCSAVCKDELKTEEIKVLYYKLEEKEVKDLLKSLNINYSSLTLFPLQDKYFYPLITLETKNIRIISSIEKIIDSLLYEKREELTCALAGDEFMRAS